MVMAEHFGKNKEAILFEVIHSQSNLKRKCPIDQNSTKGALQNLISMGIVECRPVLTNMPPHKYLKKINYRLLIGFERILYANYKYGEDI